MADISSPANTGAAPVSSFEQAYGPIADSYAQQYGIPTDIFRNVIRDVSGFNPQNVSGTGQGIANLNTTPATVDPMNPGASLDFVAKYIASANKIYSDWNKAAQSFTDPNMDPLTRNDGSAQDTKPADAAPADNTWSGKIAAFFKQSAYTLLIVMIGLILIAGSVWILVQSSGKE